MPGIVLITGASQGIGLATAELLADSGYKVYATCRDPKRATDLRILGERKSNVTILDLDVTSNDSINYVVTTIFNKQGRIDVVVNNAGFGIYGPTEMHTIKEAESIFNTNILGVMRINHAVVPMMRRQREGCIINIGSLSGAKPSAHLPVYSASKAALEVLTAAEARALEPWNIRVCLIQPGPVRTGFESKTALASRLSIVKNPYAEVIFRGRENWKQIMDAGQAPSEVAMTIKEAIESPEYHLWYQTSESVREMIGRYFKDLTGNDRIPRPPHLQAKL